MFNGFLEFLVGFFFGVFMMFLYLLGSGNSFVVSSIISRIF
jgi:hypothetical protein